MNDPVPDRETIREILFRLLRSLYLYERREVDQFGLTFQQLYLLKYLRRNSPAAFTAVAAEMRLQPFGVTRLLDQLEKERLVSRTAEKHDRRQRVVAITRRGMELTERIEDEALNMVLGNLARYTPEELRAVMRVIGDLDGILGVGAPAEDRRES